MEAKQKAEELVNKFKNYSRSSIDSEIAREFNLKEIKYTKSKFTAMMRWSRTYHAKKIALIAVDEILDLSIGHFDDNSDYVNYWQQVKQEIQKL